MVLTWDVKKAEDTWKRRKLRFEDAQYVLNDPLRLIRRDDDNSIYEERYQTIGMAGKLLFVVYTEDGPDDSRIISMRLAGPKERRVYYGTDYETNIYGWERNTP